MEIMTVVVLVCLLGGPDGDHCQEEIVARVPSTTHTCVVTMAQLVDWKLHSEFKSDQWIMKRISCHKDDYKPKEAI
jgi:hypothetical protein